MTWLNSLVVTKTVPNSSYANIFLNTFTQTTTLISYSSLVLIKPFKLANLAPPSNVLQGRPGKVSSSTSSRSSTGISCYHILNGPRFNLFPSLTVTRLCSCSPIFLSGLSSQRIPRKGE